MAEERGGGLYRRLMGVPKDKLARGGGAHPSTVEVLYYAYRRGFWALLRGLLLRPRLRHSGGRLFVGRGANILFPGHLSAGRNVAIGDYTYMSCRGGRGVELGDNVRIREFGWVQVSSHLTHPGEGLAIGANTYIGPHCVLGAGGGIEIGADVTMGAYVQLLAENHNFDDPGRPINEQGVRRRGIRVEPGSWIGNSAIILDGVTLGARSVVGAGSVVTHDVAPGGVVAGNPARPVQTGERPAPGGA